MLSPASIRQPIVSGSFYPGKPDKLVRLIRSFFQQCTAPRIENEIIGLIVPHAGYIYSGLTAAEAYYQLRQRAYDIVVIFAPSHSEPITGISVFDGAAFRTPLGDVPVDWRLARQLAQTDKRFQLTSAGHREEHSLEVQLPFLQVVLGDFQLLPIAINDLDWELIGKLATVLTRLLTPKKTLFVASSDLSHYHSDRQAREMDALILDLLEHFDTETLFLEIENGTCEACGAAPVLAVMQTMKRLAVNQVNILRYMTSSDINFDSTRVVGYVSATFAKEKSET